MKQRLGQMDGDGSLDLLLDTLCNVFGGIVLIACLLAILPRHNTPPPLLPSQAASSEMIERRLSLAKEEVGHLESEIKRLSLNTDPKLAELQNRRASLEKLRDKLQNERKVLQDQEVNEAEAEVLMATGDIDSLKDMLNVLRLRISQEEGVDAASKEKIAFLEKRIQQLSDEAATIAKGKTRAVRFPRERNSSNDPFPIIVQYNAVYPLALGIPMLNNPAIKQIPRVDRDAFLARPLPGRGIIKPLDSRELLDTLKEASRLNSYATVYLYTDSHEVFLDLREVLASSGIRYGLEFVEKSRELYFSSTGSAPPEL